jgi:hypothetical protein
MYKLAVALLCDLAACALWLSTPGCVFACSCAPPGPPKVELSQSVSVFAGRVTHIEKPSGTIISSADPISITFQVSTVWKGPAYKTLVVQSARDSASCGFPFEPGQEYIVYARGSETHLLVSLCSRTQPLADAGEDIGQLGQGITPQGEQQLSPLPADATTSAPGAVATPTPVGATTSLSASTTPVAILLGILLLVGVPVVWGIGRLTRQ